MTCNGGFMADPPAWNAGYADSDRQALSAMPACGISFFDASSGERSNHGAPDKLMI